jgi:tight adherence protein B
MLLILKIAIFLLFFSSIVMIVSVAASIVMEFMRKVHEKKLELAAQQLDTMFIEVEKNRLFYWYMASPLAAGIVILILSRNPLIALGGAVAGLFIPTAVINFMLARRRVRFQAQLIDGIMILSSSLKGGLSLLQAIEALVEEMPVPFSEEFGLILRENKMGVSLDESLRKLVKRMDLEEVKLLVNSMLVAKETGGDLIKVLSRLALTVRDNRKLKETMRTLTLQGKLQGIIMSALPVFFISSVVGFNRDHFDIMLQNDIGRVLLIIAAALQIIGLILIHRFSKIKM